MFRKGVELREMINDSEDENDDVRRYRNERDVLDEYRAGFSATI